MLSIDVDGNMMLDGQPVPNDAAGLMRAMATDYKAVPTGL